MYGVISQARRRQAWRVIPDSWVLPGGRTEAAALVSRSNTTRISGSAKALTAGLGIPSIPDVTMEREIGHGGMGTVWQGRQTYLDRTVAVKVLRFVADRDFAARFQREAKILARLSHPHIVACHNAGIASDGRPYLMMEYVEGSDLRRHVTTHGALPPAAAARIVREVAEGLAHAQAQGVIHRDVKADNVLLSPRVNARSDDPFPWTAKLADLGLARQVRATPGSADNLTATGQMVGTPMTMAPEQFNDPENVDHRADIYGLGCVLYLALTGIHAFTGPSFAEIVASKVSGPTPDPSRVAPDLPIALATLCTRMLARDRERRPQDYAGIVADLQQCEAKPVWSPTRSRRVPLLVGAAATLLLVTLGSSCLLLRQRTAETSLPMAETSSNLLALAADTVKTSVPAEHTVLVAEPVEAKVIAQPGPVLRGRLAPRR